MTRIIFLNQQMISGLLKSILVLSIALINNHSYSQSPNQDIRKVTVTSRWALKDGTKTEVSWAVYQEIFDSLGRLHTEIEWNFNDHYPHKYWWHTFNGSEITRTDCFENEKLQTRKEFSYKDDLLSQEVIKKVVPGDTTVYTVLTYGYNQQKKPIAIEAKTKEGKLAYKLKSTYDNKGTELKRSVSAKSGFFPMDSIMKMDCKPLYDSVGRLSKNIVTITRIGKPADLKDYRYFYDSKNNIIGITILDSKGKQISREARIFQPSRNRLTYIKRYDSSDKLIVWLEKRYEIYRNQDRRVREIDY